MNCCDYDCRQGRDCPARKLTEADLDARISEKAPAPAEACTEIGADDFEPMTWRDLAWVIGLTSAAMVAGFMAAGYVVGLATR